MVATEISLGDLPPGVAGRLIAGMERGGPGECWEWQRGRLPSGYGRIKVRVAPGVFKDVYVHRVAYVLAHGPLQSGECVLHSCDNPPCCNPAHLRAGSLQDNVRDRDERGRTFRGRNPRLSAAIKGKPNRLLRRLAPETVIWARGEVEAGRRSLGSIARELGMTRSAVTNAVRGITYREVV